LTTRSSTTFAETVGCSFPDGRRLFAPRTPLLLFLDGIQVLI
jgi:hypothetical protein